MSTLDVGTVVGDIAAAVVGGPIGWIKVAADVIPAIVSWIGGDDAGDMAKQVASTVQSITGESDPATAQAKLQADPNLRFQLQMQLAQLQDAQKKREHEEAMQQEQDRQAEMVAKLQDLASARTSFSQNEEVMKLAKWLLFSFAFVSSACVAGSFLVLGGVIKVDTGNVGMVSAIFGFLGTIFGAIAASAMTVVTFFFGSSQMADSHSAQMTNAVLNLGNAMLPPTKTKATK